MEQIVIYLLIVQKLLNSKQKIQIVATVLCLGNISKDFSLDNMKKAGLKGYFFSVVIWYDMILVLIIMLLQLLMYETFSNF